MYCQFCLLTVSVRYNLVSKCHILNLFLAFLSENKLIPKFYLFVYDDILDNVFPLLANTRLEIANIYLTLSNKPFITDLL